MFVIHLRSAPLCIVVAESYYLFELIIVVFITWFFSSK
jgi:hypothetical protein